MVAFDVPLDLDSGAPAAVDTKYNFIQSVGRELPLQYHCHSLGGFEIHLHLVWITKYCRPALSGEVGNCEVHSRAEHPG
jgi:hypothetical protein